MQLAEVLYSHFVEILMGDKCFDIETTTSAQLLEVEVGASKSRDSPSYTFFGMKYDLIE